MESRTFRWSAPSLTRHKTAIIALTALALGCSLYYVHHQISSPDLRKPATHGLRRSNARRQRRRATAGSPPRTPSQVFDPTGRYEDDQPWGSAPIDLGFLQSAAVSDQRLADHILVSRGGRYFRVALRRHLPTLNDIRGFIDSPEDAAICRHELELTFLSYHFFRYLSPSPINDEQRDTIMHELGADEGFSPDVIRAVLSEHQSGYLRYSVLHYTQTQQSREAYASREQLPLPSLSPSINQNASELQTLRDVITATDDESEHSWRGEDEIEDSSANNKEGQGLLNLLYRIAEEQARKDGYVHRRVTCNACNAMPIRGVRYHCANCFDYDLCEQCEAMQIHPKTHIFYKIRIPAPFMRNPRQPEPVWYPGKPTAVNLSLARDSTANICKKTGFQVAEIEALWEQFRCLAGTEWPDDPGGYGQAIDRPTFDKCFVPQTSLRPPPPNLIYDRMFAFYDENSDGLIGFREFIDGLVSLTRQKADERYKKIFKGYDINNDGYVDRKDFLRIFRAYYALTKELTRDIIAGMEDDVSDSGARDIILGSQPISSAFTGAIPPGERSRSGEGKLRDEYGDLVMLDNTTVVDENRNHMTDLNNFTPTLAEIDRGLCENLENIYRIYNDPWPPDGISAEDVREVLDRATDLREVTVSEKQEKIRRYVHSTLAEDYMKGHGNLRRILCEERSKRAFTSIGSDGMSLTNFSVLDRMDGAFLPQSDSKYSKSLERVEAMGRSDEFYHLLKQRIKNTGWPVRGSWISLAKSIVELIMSDCTAKSIAEDLRGYTTSVNNSETFIMSVFKDLEAISGQMDLEKTGQGSNWKSQSSRRSRSSSKVRFQDDIETEECQESRSRATSISSRSIPMNERWGGLDMSEPESDVGREVLFQATQEGLNELLDPIFKLREDLALAALRTQRRRERFRTEAAAVAEARDPVDLVRGIRLFQQRWRRDPSFHICVSDCEDAVGDDVGPFQRFLKLWSDKDSSAASVTEKCPGCLKRGEQSSIRMGGYCSTCCQNSTYLSHYLQNGKVTPMERCPRCNEESTIGGTDTDDSFFCAKCGQESEFFKAENARLIQIISGGQLPVTTRTTVSDKNTTTISKFSPGTESIPEHLKSGRGLAESVAAFDNIDPSSLEQHISQKPLNDLLADSGYSLATTPQTPSPPPDPTLPQNKPNSLPPQMSPEFEDQGPREQAQSDLTLPQNRPNSPSQPSHLPSLPTTRSPSPEPFPDLNILPDSDTLRYYAALTLLEHEDKERGGPGRLNLEEFEEVMKGEKGKSLGFLGTWMEMASF